MLYSAFTLLGLVLLFLFISHHHWLLTINTPASKHLKQWSTPQIKKNILCTFHLVVRVQKSASCLITSYYLIPILSCKTQRGPATITCHSVSVGLLHRSIVFVQPKHWALWTADSIASSSVVTQINSRERSVDLTVFSKRAGVWDSVNIPHSCLLKTHVTNYEGYHVWERGML